MKCPKCEKEILFGSKQCAVCKTDVSLLAELAWAKQDLAGARNHEVGLARKLEEVDRRLLNLEKDLIQQIRSTSEHEAALEAEAKPAEEPTDIPAFSLSAMAEEKREAAPSPTSLTTSGEEEETAGKPEAHPLPPPKFIPPRPSVPQRHPDREREAASAELKLGQKGLLITGLSVVVLGIGYFLKFSFDNNWIPPEARVGVSYMAGLVSLAVGGWFTRRDVMRNFGLCLVGGAVAMFYFSTFAGHQYYGLFGSQVAFALMVAVTAIACGLAVRYDTQWLAVLGLIGGFTTPFVLDVPNPDPFGLLMYAAILNGGVLSVAAFKGWVLLNHLGFILTWLLFAGCCFNSAVWEDFWKTSFYLHLFFLIYAVTPFARHLLQGAKARFIEYSYCLPNVFFALLFATPLVIEHFDSRRPLSVVTLAYAFLFLGMAFRIHQKNSENRIPVHLLVGLAATLFTLTIPILFEGNWITLFGFIETVVLFELSHRLKAKGFLTGAFLVFLISIAKLILVDLGTHFGLTDSLVYESGFVAEWAARWMTFAGFLIATGWLQSRSLSHPLVSADSAKETSSLLKNLVVLELFVLASLETITFLNEYLPNASNTGISVVWALFSVALMVAGFVRRNRMERHAAMALFTVTLLKVFVVDMANVATPYRILSLIVLGVLMIAASFLYYRFAGRVLGEEETVPPASRETVA